jgi:transglutaminase-like putative cysteine protease
MHRWIRILIFSGGVLTRAAAFGQDSDYSQFGKIVQEDFHPSSSVVDSNADVVVLQDVGRTELEGHPEGWKVKYMRYRRLLIRNRKGFDATKIELTFNPYKNGFGKLASLRANTYNLEGGKILRTRVDSADMFLEPESDELKERFSFPDIKEGSVIEYVYTIYAGSIYNLHFWNFQGAYPCIYSSYTITFPVVFNYVVTKQGSLPVTRTNDSMQTHVAIGSYVMRTESYIIHWEMKDVPAFKKEPFMSTTGNYVTGIRFQLSEYTELDTRRRKKFLGDWKALNEDLYKSKAFGGIMTTSSHWLRKELRTIVEDSVNEMDKARALFTFVRDHFTSTGRAYLSDDDISLKDIFKARKGDVAQINLLLTAMMREGGISADAVILSTRDNGVINPYYPIIENFNYVVVRCRIGGRTYFLDASEPRMGFGHLPLDCYNGYARVVSEQPDSVFFRPDSLVESKIVMVVLTSNDAGDSLSGAYAAQRGYYTSLDIRDEIADKGEDVYFEGVRKSYPFDIRLTERHIDSLLSYDQPVTVRYGLSFSTGGGDRLYFNPMLSELLKENLFSAATRHYPVEMKQTFNELYLLRMDIPAGYEIEELPKPVRVRLNEGDGSYEYGFLVDETSIQFRSRLILKRTFFQPEDYQSLRDFFAQVVKKENEVIVFRKKK